MHARTPGLYSLIVMRDGKPLLERYYDGASAAQPFPVCSITKSVVSALVGVAIADGKIASLQQPLGELLDVPPSADPRVRRITLEQLLTMSAGWTTSRSAARTSCAISAAGRSRAIPARGGSTTTARRTSSPRS